MNKAVKDCDINNEMNELKSHITFSTNFINVYNCLRHQLDLLV